MKFEWDERKRRANLRKHGIDFVRVARYFDRLAVVGFDEREDYGEERWIAVGYLGNVLAVVVFTMPDEEIVRLISARKVSRRERENLYS